MQITKFGHSCLLVEVAGPVKRTVLFDPGVYSTVPVESLGCLDDICITHSHPDHFDVEIIKRLVARFPQVRITTTAGIVQTLTEQDVAASTIPPEGIELFESPHEPTAPVVLAVPPQETGFHCFNLLTHPGDSHSFTVTKPVLALPVQAPWGSLVDAVALALKLKPRVVVPIHDWHWNDEARQMLYAQLEKRFLEEGIVFVAPKNGQSFVTGVSAEGR